MNGLRWLPHLWLIVLLALVGAAAQEEAAEQLLLEPAEAAYWEFRQNPDGGEILLAWGGCVLRYADVELHADSLVVWLRERDPAAEAGSREGAMETEEGDGPLAGGGGDDREGTGGRYAQAQVYAEGEPALLVRGLAGAPPGILPGDPRVEQAAIQQFQGKRLFFDLLTGKGLILEAAVRGLFRFRERPVPLHLRAEEIRTLGFERLEAADVVLSTCTFAEPHWRFHPRHVLIREGRTGGTRRIEARKTTVELGSVPVLYIPWVGGELGRRGLGRRVPLQRVQVGRSSPFGAFVETDWGGDLPLELGSWVLEADGYSRRGAAVGLDLVWDLLGGRGFVDTYLVPDDAYEDPRFEPRERDIRGRVRAAHRQPLSRELRLDLELSYLSDRSFLEEYFETEAKTGKEQETVAYLRWRHEDLLASALGKVRINEFDTTTQYLPRVALDLAAAPIPGGALYLDLETEVAHLERRWDNDLDLAPERTDRVDALPVLGIPLRLGPVGLDLWGGGRYTGYSRTRRRSSWDDRFVAMAGGRAALNLQRVYDVEVPALDVHRLRHIVTPQISYVGEMGVTLEPRDLYLLDRVDLVDDRHTLRLGLLNRLQTKAPVSPGEGVDGRLKGLGIDVLWLDVEAVLHPDGDREWTEEYFGGVETDLTWRVRDGLTFLGEARVGGGGRPDLDELALGVDWRLELGSSRDEEPVERYVDLLLGHRHRGDLSSVTSLDLETRIDARWGLRSLVQYDWDDGRLSTATLALRRHLHDFIVTFGVGWDDGEDNLDISLGVTLRDLDPEGRRAYHPGEEPYLDFQERDRLGRRAPEAPQLRESSPDLEPEPTEERTP